MLEQCGRSVIIVLITFAAMGLLMAMMAVGVVFGERRLRGSCGGRGGDDCVCDEDGKPIESSGCDVDPRECDIDEETCALASKTCELKHAHGGGGLFAKAMRAVVNGDGAQAD